MILWRGVLYLSASEREGRGEAEAEGEDRWIERYGVLHVAYIIAEMNMKLKYHIAKNIVLAGKPVTMHSTERYMHAMVLHIKHVSAADKQQTTHSIEEAKEVRGRY